MKEVKIKQPELAVTQLNLFSSWGQRKPAAESVYCHPNLLQNEEKKTR
jgi:hypothetical protein